MLVCHFVGGYISHNLSYHLPSLFIPPILNLPLSLPGIHLTTTRLPGFKFTVLIFLSQLIGPVLPQGAPQSIPHRSYVHIHTPVEGLSCGGLVAANGGEDEVDWEPRPSPKH